jgi:hypothetical protein
MKIGRGFLIVMALVMALPPLRAEFRTFKNDFGESVEAELLAFKEDESLIRMRLKNGREIDAKLSVFSQADQKYIREWWKDAVAAQELLNAETRLRINVKMNRKSRSGTYDRWYADDKVKSFFPEVVIDNRDVQTYTGNTVRIVVFAEDRYYKDRILVVSASDLKADFAELEETVLEGEPFRLRLYEYTGLSSSDYEYGYEYTGYALAIKNAKGETTHEKASKSKFLNPKFFSKCKTGQIYDENFERKLDASPNSYFVR